MSNDINLLFCDVYECLEILENPSLEYNTVLAMKDYICKQKTKINKFEDRINTISEYADSCKKSGLNMEYGRIKALTTK